ncbi:MAG TPA: FMN-dependent NADH-azoreductase [Casimicrobiaceae bacterium]|nr:FMN-dependent NADH-azoreductase [Casimicrobiaceae bacterium]
MKKILLVTSSAAGAQSRTRQVSDRVVQSLLAREPGSRVAIRDVSRDPLPHLDDTFLAGMGRAADERSAGQHEALSRSDALIDELVAADVVVIAAPMYNFGIPSALKAWIDHVARAGRTFRYTANGPEGLLNGKRAILVLSRGGVYTKGPMLRLEFQESYLRGVLGFLGIDDVRSIHIEGVALGADVAEAAVKRALEQAESVADEIVLEREAIAA